MNPLLKRLQHHVTGAIERGEGVAIVGVPAAELYDEGPCEAQGPKRTGKIRTVYDDRRDLLAALKFALESGDEFEAEKRARATIALVEGNL